MNVIRRAVEAYKDGRLLSGAVRHITQAPLHAKQATLHAALRLRLGLPQSTRRALPVIVTSGDFAGCEARALKRSLGAAADGRSKLPDSVRDIRGMSGQRYRTLVNTLVQELDQPRYLEIGSWRGSTAAAAIYGNNIEAVCIDNWSQFSGTKAEFLTNIGKATSSSNSVELMERDFRKVDYRVLGKFKIYLFDGPHSEMDHRDGILVVQPCLADRFILIVDDWNMDSVRVGTMRGLVAAKCRVEASVQVRTTNDGTLPSVASEASDWHNGYFIAVVRKILG